MKLDKQNLAKKMLFILPASESCVDVCAAEWTELKKRSKNLCSARDQSWKIGCCNSSELVSIRKMGGGGPLHGLVIWYDAFLPTVLSALVAAILYQKTSSWI
jgi:hypothetical protein